MGYFRHHAIIVTGSPGTVVAEAYARAAGIFPVVSPVLESIVTGYHSFFIPPDGSKELWLESQKGDDRRAAFIEYLGSLRYGDGSPMLDWLEIEYGDEAGAEAKILNDSARYDEEES